MTMGLSYPGRFVLTWIGSRWSKFSTNGTVPITAIAKSRAATVPFTYSASTKADPSGTSPCSRVRELRPFSATTRTAAQSRRAHNWEAVNGNKKESKTQDQGEAQENHRHQGGYTHKDQDRQKNRQGQKEAGEESAGAASITQESQAAETARSSQTNAEPARPTDPAGGPYRH